MNMLLMLSLACKGGDDPACADADCADTGPSSTDDSSPPDDSATDDSGTDTAPEPDWSLLPEGCEAPSDLPGDPLTMVGSIKKTQDTPGGFFVELIDLEIDGDRVYGVGQGGLMVYDASDPSSPALYGSWPNSGNSGRYHRVEVLSDTVVAVTNRESGIAFFDVSDPYTPAMITERFEEGLEGLAKVGDHLIVSARGGQTVVFDVSNPSAPSELSRTGGPSNTWDYAKADGWIYAADNVLGIVPIDVSTPSAPQIKTPIGLDGALQHLAVDGDTMYAALGGSGVTVLDRSDPESPIIIAQVSTGGSTVQVAAGDGLLWAVDHEGLTSWDVTDPADPKLIHREITEQYALAVQSEGSRAWVGDWNILSGWDVDASILAGDLDVPSDNVYIPSDGSSSELTITNRGGGTLTLAGGSVGEAGLIVETDFSSLESGESGHLRLTWETGGDLQTELCLASDDPDGPVRTLSVVAGENHEVLGQTAPDFELKDLDGNLYRLSDQLGHPVVIAYFATW